MIKCLGDRGEMLMNRAKFIFEKCRRIAADRRLEKDREAGLSRDKWFEASDGRHSSDSYSSKL